MTNIGAPKEYYKGLAYLVNPNDVDDIGGSVLKAMEHSTQPTLQEYIIENFHIKSCMILLEDALKRIQWTKLKLTCLNIKDITAENINWYELYGQ